MKELRKRRINEQEREIAAETRLCAEDFVLPYFVVDGRGIKKEINSMPGIYRFSVDELIKEIRTLQDIKNVLLFGIPKDKDDGASQAYNDNGVVQQAVKAIKKKFSEITVVTDVCLCGYSTHGHCGIVRDKYIPGKDFIDNGATLEILSKISVSHAQAGADFVAPSAMMDRQVRAIKKALEENGFKATGILAYSAKYASNFYGPFREVVRSAPKFGDRKTYQLDYRNSDEALMEIQQDIKEGADIIMVKPALSYLDIICKAKQKFNVPVAAYNVSGEYSMLKKVSGGDKKKEKELVLEVLTAIKRAGADIIISYFAKEAVQWIKKDD